MSDDLTLPAAPVGPTVFRVADFEGMVEFYCPVVLMGALGEFGNTSSPVVGVLRENSRIIR